MSEIDPEKLEEAIRILRGWWCHGAAETFGFNDKARIDIVCTAAETLLSTLPRVKEVEVWRVEWAGAGGVPCIDQDTDKSFVEQVADEKRGLGRQCIRVTGPHKQRVPA